ncbi:copper resistance protein CopC [Rhizobium cauense]|uniref:copper resistance protein CopC n=1 Tax=Rhizobium cauense TaxID=1166683 RepID=UPI001C6EBB52|nr:copper resistance protein CopC [Rhizobium cauense]MBW9116444.1 copper resistance protein CopC [Rhizobium cauense]
MLQKILVVCLTIAAISATPTAAVAGMGQIIPFTGSEVSLSFSYDVDLAGSHFELRDSANRELPCSNAKQDATEGEIVVPTNARLDPGSYTLTWKALIPNGGWDEGSLAFEVAE